MSEERITMTPTEAADFLRSYNKWRIFGGLKQPSPGEISKSFYAVIDMIDRLEAAEKERNELRAKVEAMERQEPVATKLKTSQFQCFTVSKEAGDKLAALPVGAKLYALPGAKGEEK